MECPNDRECDTVGEMCCPVTKDSKTIIKLCTPVEETQTPSKAPYPPYLAKIYRNLPVKCSNLQKADAGNKKSMVAKSQGTLADSIKIGTLAVTSSFLLYSEVL